MQLYTESDKKTGESKLMLLFLNLNLGHSTLNVARSAMLVTMNERNFGQLYTLNISKNNNRNKSYDNDNVYSAHIVVYI